VVSEPGFLTKRLTAFRKSTYGFG